MTIGEFYNWARENNMLDAEMLVQYRDDGGDYYGQTNELYMVDAENIDIDVYDDNGYAQKRCFEKVVIL